MLRDSLVWAVLFTIGIIAGVIMEPKAAGILEETFKQLKDLVGHAKPSVMALKIFEKNVIVVLVCVILGRLTKGIIPGMICLYNGFLLGVVGVFAHLSALVVIAGVLPHGIFELPAIFIACSIGMNDYKVTLKLKKTVFPILLLIIAAIIETWITPGVMKALM
ncbi:MAG: stage II sporulation protein M [Acidobacteriota bacterium]